MTITQVITLEEITCGTCGIVFAVPSNWIAERRANAGDIHCPNGCVRTWRESDAQRLKKQLEARERELREAKCEILRKQQLIDEGTRKLNRVQRGVCPCCKRSFSNLARHMEKKHPEKKS